MNNIIGSKRQMAIKLRKQGKSYNEINKVLSIAKSTLSTWLKDLPLSKQIKYEKIKQVKLIWSKNITNYNKKRSKIYQKKVRNTLEKYSKKVPDLNNKSLFWIGLALFWAEGGKREKFSVRFANSDPLMIKIILSFFRKTCCVSDEKIKLRIHLYPNMDELTVRKYWSKITNLPLGNFYKSQMQISRSSKGKRPKSRLPNGTLHIIIGDSYLIKRIKGWILGLIKQIN